jgi:hypothetical protein
MSRRPSLPQPSPGISRVDQKSTRTHGYVGRLGYRQTETGWRPAFKAFFGDASNGGPAGALKAAEAWLKQARRKLAAEAKTGGAVSSRAGAKAARKGAGARRATGTKRAGKAVRKGGTVRVASRRKRAASSAR